MITSVCTSINNSVVSFKQYTNNAFKMSNYIGIINKLDSFKNIVKALKGGENSYLFTIFLAMFSGLVLRVAVHNIHSDRPNKIKKIAFLNVFMSIFLVRLVHGIKQTYIFNGIIMFNIVLLGTFTKTLKKYKHIIVVVNIVLGKMYEILYNPCYELSAENDLIGPLFIFGVRMAYAVENFNGDWYMFLSYIYFSPSVLVGPVVEYADFTNFINNKDTKPINATFIIKNICTAAYGMFNYIAIQSLNIDQNIFITNSFTKKLLYMFLFGVRKKSQLYAVWSIMSIGIAFCGIEYNNINFTQIEFVGDFSKHARNWNITAHIFFKRYFYDFLVAKFNNKISKGKIIWITFFLSAFMHSMKFCEYAFFVGFAVSTKYVDILVGRLTSFYPIKLFITHLYLSFLIMIKDAPSKEMVFALWGTVHYVGFVMIIVLFLMVVVKEVVLKVLRMCVRKKTKIEITERKEK